MRAVNSGSSSQSRRNSRNQTSGVNSPSNMVMGKRSGGNLGAQRPSRLAQNQTKPSSPRQPQSRGAVRLPRLQAFSPEDTFHMIKDADQKLATKNVFLDEQAHEAKRTQLLERAAIIKKRMDMQNQQQAGEGVRKSRFDIMAECKFSLNLWLKITPTPILQIQILFVKIIQIMCSDTDRFFLS